MNKIWKIVIPNYEEKVPISKRRRAKYYRKGDLNKKSVAKKEVKTKVEGKPAEVKAVSTHCDVPYIPRRIDRLPPDLNKLKK